MYSIHRAKHRIFYPEMTDRDALKKMKNSFSHPFFLYIFRIRNRPLLTKLVYPTRCLAKGRKRFTKTECVCNFDSCNYM